MFDNVKLKSGETLWYKTTQQNVGYHEIARMQFARYECSKIREEIKMLKKPFEGSK